MQHAIVFHYFEFGTQASDLWDMSQFQKISTAECSYRKRTEKILGFPGTDGQNRVQYTASKNMPKASINKRQAEKNQDVWAQRKQIKEIAKQRVFQHHHNLILSSLSIRG